MKPEALIKKLELKKIDCTYIKRYCQSYVPKYLHEPSPRRRLDFINLHNLDGILKMCEPFKPYFSEEEYSKVVCKSIISYSKLHAGCLSAHSEYPELNITTLATPSKPLPKFLVTTINDNGTAKIMKQFGGDLLPII